MMMRSVWFYCSNSFWRRVRADEPCTVVGGLGDFVSRPRGSQQSEVLIRGWTGEPEVSECELRGVLSKGCKLSDHSGLHFLLFPVLVGGGTLVRHPACHPVPLPKRPFP